GVARLWERTDLPPALADYVAFVKDMNPGGQMRYYPGSPYCADRIAREQDRIRLFEMHPNDGRILQENLRKREAQLAAQGQRPGPDRSTLRGQGRLSARAQVCGRRAG